MLFEGNFNAFLVLSSESEYQSFATYTANTMRKILEIFLIVWKPL